MFKNLNYLYTIILFLISFTVNFYYGSIGVFPIDSFAFFDSANLINQGFLPIRDYWTSNGFIVDLFQSVFFKIFGVNWYAYLLHSSLLNFFLALFTYKFLTNEGLSSTASLFYSISVGILAYPSVGVPFSDHHSLIFSIISIYFFIFSLQKNSKLFLFLTILFLVIAFLSKQIPAAFFIILVSFYLLYFLIKKKNYNFILNSLIFSLSLLIFLSLFVIITNIGIKNFFIQYINFPLSIGSERAEGLKVGNFIISLFSEFKFFIFLLSIIFYQTIKVKKNNNIGKPRILSTGAIFFVITFITIVNQELMKNQNILFFVLPILTGIIHSNIKTNKNKKYFLLSSLLIFFNFFITFKYHERFNVDRKFMDLEKVNKTNITKGSKVSNNLQGLKWITKVEQSQFPNEVKLLKESMEYLKDNKNNSMIITHYQFINSEINHSIYPPNRWYTNDGVSYPLKENKYFEYYVVFFKDKLIKNQINKIYTIYPLDKNSFSFVLNKNCIRTNKINEILSEHLLINCF
jgi:hypothetical protein